MCSLLGSLVMLVCSLASLMVPGMASAGTAVGDETRAYAFNVADESHVGPAGSLTPALRPGCAPTYDELASDSLLAARGGVRTTAHGAERIAGQGATRGGVLSEAGIDAVRQGGRVMTQADGATVRILQNEAGRFNVVVEGERGIITTFENLSQKSLDRLGKNYGWQ